MSYHVLIQPRPNFFQIKGGDNVQLEKTIEYLRAQDVTAEISVDAHSDLTSFDVVELYNLGEGLMPLRYFLNARRQNKPLVTMPIYWNLDRFRRAQQEWSKSWEPAPGSEASTALLAHRETLRHTSETLCRILLLEQSDLILPNSNVEGKLLARDLHAPAENMRVVYNGAESFFQDATPDLFIQRYGLRDFVLCVARIAPQKNQLNLVKAWAHQEIPLVLIGNDRQDPRYTGLVHAAAGRNTIFLDEADHTLIASAYAAARVHVLASWFEMMPLAALEAGLAGCNLVLTTETAGPEFFGDRVWYCEPDDSTSIRQAIHAAFAAPRRPDLAAHIREHFTWDKTASQLSRIYGEAIERHSGTPQVEASAHTRHLEELVVTLDALAQDNETLAQQSWEESVALAAQLQRIEQFPVVSGLEFVKKRLNRSS